MVTSAAVSSPLFVWSVFLGFALMLAAFIGVVALIVGVAHKVTGNRGPSDNIITCPTEFKPRM
jgi:dolichol kinase